MRERWPTIDFKWKDRLLRLTLDRISPPMILCELLNKLLTILWSKDLQSLARIRMICLRQPAAGESGSHCTHPPHTLMPLPHYSPHFLPIIVILKKINSHLGHPSRVVLVVLYLVIPRINSAQQLLCNIITWLKFHNEVTRLYMVI